ARSLSDVRMVVLTSGDGRLQATVDRKSRMIAPGATAVVPLTITAADPLSSASAVTVLARHGDGSRAGSGAGSATVEVKPAPVLDPSSLVRVRVAPAKLEVVPGRKTPARAEFSIENIGHERLELTDIEVHAPDKVHYDAHGERPTIAPGATAELAFDVT